MKRGTHHTPESKERIRQTLLRRWRQEPGFGKRQLEAIRAATPKGTKASADARRLPRMSADEQRHYNKVRQCLGAQVARAML